ncbi:hypothetical protein ACFWBB_21395 [Streptomyces sp. NPDC060000]|uniref:hypothetical protein n=1 Tax=Streptomyces sp. NPDC060000 TaxID=3347031 RepID=UPI0036CAC51A
MGYEFHITRAESWTESEEFPIGRAEWEQVAEACDAIELQGDVEWNDIGAQPVYGAAASTASFSWRLGRVDISGHLDDSMWSIAESLAEELQAYLVGDDE